MSRQSFAEKCMKDLVSEHKILLAGLQLSKFLPCTHRLIFLQNLSFAECQLAVPTSNEHKRVPIVGFARCFAKLRVHNFSASVASFDNDQKLLEEEIKLPEPTAVSKTFAMVASARSNPKLFLAEDFEIDSDDSSSCESILFTDSEDEDDFMATS